MIALMAVKKKPKKKALLNMGRRFKETICQIPVGGDSSEEDENQVGEVKSTKLNVLMIKYLMMIISTSSIHPLISNTSS